MNVKCEKKYCVKNGDKILYKIDLCHTQGRQQGGGAGGHLSTLISKTHFYPFPFWEAAPPPETNC